MDWSQVKKNKMNYNEFAINGHILNLNSIVEILGVTREDGKVIEEHGYEWRAICFRGDLTKAWLESTKTKHTIVIDAEMDRHFVVVCKREEEGK